MKQFGNKILTHSLKANVRNECVQSSFEVHSINLIISGPEAYFVYFG